VQHHFRVIQDCPCPAGIAPYIYVVTHAAHATVNSIYRGQDAAALLHKYGKHTQAELYDGYQDGEPGFYPANPPGFSTHELKSDGVAYPNFPRGADLPWWCQGFDVNDSDVEHVEYQASLRGWELFRPYTSGVEYHHLNFKVQPHPDPKRADSNLVRLNHLRDTLPRS
jgi:hypothetical protein